MPEHRKHREKRRAAGLDPEYIRLREAREVRRREVERMIGFSDTPARAWGKADARRTAIRRKRAINFRWEE